MSAFQIDVKKEDAHTEPSVDLNGMFVNNERGGCEWYTLTDDLTNEVHGLGIDDLHSVTAQLLSSQPLSSSDETSLSMDDPLHYPLISGLDVIQETCESSSLDEGDGDIETETMTETTPEETVTSEYDMNFVPRHNRKPTTSSPSMKRLMLSTKTASTSESNNSDSSIQSYTSGQGKRKGGWPKGRKRKPPDMSELKPPKAPSTGYVFYLIDKRKHYKNLPFHEVTKLLGNEWTKLDKSQKKFYLDKAEIDKKRYREELRVYRKSDAYQTYLRWKRAKRRQTNGTEESDFDATDEIEEEDNEELYCKACDQWFVTFHNKKEHLYGKQHLGKISSKWKQSLRATPTTSNDNSSSYSLDESSLDAAPMSPKRNTNVTFNCDITEPASPSMNESIISVMKSYSERENEINYLKNRVGTAQQRCKDLNKQIGELKLRKKQLSKMTSTMKEEEKRYQRGLSKFWSIVSLFVTVKGDAVTS